MNDEWKNAKEHLLWPAQLFGLRSRGQIQNDNFRRNAKPHWNDACADASGYIEVATGFANVTTRISLAVSRWHNQSAEARQIDLPPMSMTRQRQADARWNPRKYVRAVGDYDDGVLVAYLLQSASDIGLSAFEVLKASQPESTVVEIKSDHRIAQHPYSSARQSRGLRRQSHTNCRGCPELHTRPTASGLDLGGPRPPPAP